MAAPKKYSDDLRALVHQLINEEHRPATQIAPLLRKHGYDQIPPIDTLREWARASKERITDKPKAAQLKELTGLAVEVIHDGFSRIQATNTDTDPDEILKLVRSLRELEPLLSDKPTEKGDTAPTGVAGKLAVAPTPTQPGNTQDSGATPVSARVAS